MNAENKLSDKVARFFTRPSAAAAAADVMPLNAEKVQEAMHGKLSVDRWTSVIFLLRRSLCKTYPATSDFHRVGNTSQKVNSTQLSYVMFKVMSRGRLSVFVAISYYFYYYYNRT